MGKNLSKIKTFTPEQIRRKPGEIMNVMNFESQHEQTVATFHGRSRRFSVCRCWKSAYFPLCDNNHQILQKQGVNVGPVMLEIRTPSNKPQNTSAIPENQSSLGPRLYKMGALASSIAAITGYGHYFGWI